MKKYITEISLISSNLLLLIGIIYWQWEIFDVLIIYWLESFTIVIFNALKIHKCNRIRKEKTAPGYFAYFYIYLMAALVWLIFICVFFGPWNFIISDQPGGSFNVNIIFMIVFLILSHGISYKNNFIDKKEFKILSIEELFYAPIYRFVVIQVVVFFAGYYFMKTGSMMLSAIIIVLLKTFLDLFAHWQEHRTRSKLLNYCSNEKIDKIFKLTKRIAYFFIFGPMALIPLVIILDPNSIKIQFITQESIIYKILDLINIGFKVIFSVWVLILIPIGAIILVKNLKNK